MDKENIEESRNLIGEYPATFPYLLLLVDGVAISYDNEFFDFLIMGMYHNVIGILLLII